MGQRTETEQDQERAFLVNEVGFTPEQADDCTSGDIDRNGAAAMLPGVIEAFEQYAEGLAATRRYSDDDLIEAGAQWASGAIPSIGTGLLLLAALKLLQRARAAELQVAQLKTQMEAEVAKQLTSALAAHAALRQPAVDPTAAALAVIDDIETNGALGPVRPLPPRPVDDGSPIARDNVRIHEARLSGRAQQVERLARAIASVAHRDVKPAYPLWCVRVENPDRERPWLGPFDDQAGAEAAAAEIRDGGDPATVRRCRRVRASEALWGRALRWQLERLAETLDEDEAGEVPEGLWFDCERPWVRVRTSADLTALDTVLEVDVFETEPEGATP